MFRAFRGLALATVFACGAFVPAAKAVVLDWSSLTWAPGSLDTTYDTDPTKPGTERVQFTGFTGDITAGSPQINSALEGGQGAGKLSLNLSVDLGREDRSITVTITFANYPLGVEGVSFTLFNIDRDGAIYVDQIRSISGTAADGVTLVAPTITNLGANVSLTGSGLNQALTGTNPVAATGAGSGAGNATISFNGPIRSFTFLLGDDGVASRNPPPQSIAIGNINFSPVPEVNPAALAAAGCVLASVYVGRRRTSRRRAPQE
jgi:hypothetical protein